jgi:hypothetical protein
MYYVLMTQTKGVTNERHLMNSTLSIVSAAHTLEAVAYEAEQQAWASWFRARTPAGKERIMEIVLVRQLALKEATAVHTQARRAQLALLDDATLDQLLISVRNHLYEAQMSDYSIETIERDQRDLADLKSVIATRTN